MRTFLVCITLALMLCEGASEARKRRHPHPDAGDGGATGRAGAVCRLGEEREGMRRPAPRVVKVEACAPGLACGYPCGIPGCNWVCMSPAQGQQRRP